MDQRQMGYEEQEAARAERLAEQGTMPLCPLCESHKPAKRSTRLNVGVTSAYLKASTVEIL